MLVVENGQVGKGVCCNAWLGDYLMLACVPVEQSSAVFGWVLRRMGIQGNAGNGHGGGRGTGEGDYVVGGWCCHDIMRGMLRRE